MWANTASFTTSSSRFFAAAELPTRPLYFRQACSAIACSLPFGQLGNNPITTQVFPGTAGVSRLLSNVRYASACRHDTLRYSSVVSDKLEHIGHLLKHNVNPTKNLEFLIAHFGFRI